MKLFKKHKYVAAATLVAAALIFTTSCTKESDNPGSVPQKAEMKKVENKYVQDKIQEKADRMPPIAWYNKTMDKVITFDPKSKTKSFDFSSPNNGWNFSDDTGVEFVEGSNGGGILFIGPGAFGGNTGSGTVVAGSTVLNVSSTFCFSASEEALGLDIIDLNGADIDGIAGVIGIAGDLEALQNVEFDEETDIFDYFQGLAYYLVYDNEASGTYDILNFIDELEEDSEGFGFSIVYGFTPNSFSLYFSKDGELEVSGGSMNFNGNYYGLVIDDLFGDDGDDIFGFDFVEAAGYGQMGCN